MVVRRQARRGQGHQLRLAHSLAEGQEHGDRAGGLMCGAEVRVVFTSCSLTVRHVPPSAQLRTRSGASSTPRPHDLIAGAAAYWIARSSRAMTRVERALAYFAFRKSATSSSMNSSSSALLGSRLDENGRLLSLPTMMWVSSTRSTFSMVKNGKV